jgi:hypothetical protein
MAAIHAITLLAGNIWIGLRTLNLLYLGEMKRDGDFPVGQILFCERMLNAQMFNAQRSHLILDDSKLNIELEHLFTIKQARIHDSFLSSYSSLPDFSPTNQCSLFLNNTLNVVSEP